ncbi:minichromosome maintenance protein 5 [Lobulomyces angularis]|nr:minichromosome maintenance protein 5 [Lobulomyces angularis]
MNLGWDAPNIQRTSVLPGQENKETRTAIKTKFMDFVRGFSLSNVYIYRDQLRQNLIMKQYFLEIDLLHLSSFDEVLSQALKGKPNELLPLFEEGVKALAMQSNLSGPAEELPNFQIMLLSDDGTLPIRLLDTSYISKLVRISGIIISASQLQAKATLVHLMCKSCRHTMVLPVSSGFGPIQLPRKCDREPLEAGERKDCPMDPYFIVHDKSVFVDQQNLKLQETPEMVPVGELPRHMQLTADSYCTNMAIPGSRVTITGIFSTFKSKQQNKTITLRSTYIRVVGMQADLDGSSRRGRSFTETEEDEFIKMSREPNFFETFANSVAPSIYGHPDIKKAITCLLFGGSKKILPDGMRLRGDINVLLLGDPGTAKSQLLKFVEKVAPIAVYTSGKGSSAAGLTASVIRDASSREFHLEGGAMVLADGGVVCIDEFDKMREEDRVAIHEAMEQQTISIAKAGITTILNSRASVLAAANPIFGRYNDMKSPGENIDFQSTILSRFDLIFIVKDDHSETRDQAIAKHVLHIHMRGAPVTSDNSDIDIQKMKSYISYCRIKCAPRLSSEAAEKLSSHFVEVRSKIRNMSKSENKKSAIPITVRQLEAIVRIAESLAKISLSPVASEVHVDEAIRLFDISTLNAIEAGPAEGFSRPQFMKEVERIQQQIRRRLPCGSQVSAASLTKDMATQGFGDMAIDRAIYLLVQKEVLRFVDRRLIIRRINL